MAAITAEFCWLVLLVEIQRGRSIWVEGTMKPAFFVSPAERKEHCGASPPALAWPSRDASLNAAYAAGELLPDKLQPSNKQLLGHFLRDPRLWTPNSLKARAHDAAYSGTLRRMKPQEFHDYDARATIGQSFQAGPAIIGRESSILLLSPRPSSCQMTLVMLRQASPAMEDC